MTRIAKLSPRWPAALRFFGACLVTLGLGLASGCGGSTANAPSGSSEPPPKGGLKAMGQKPPPPPPPPIK